MNERIHIFEVTAIDADLLEQLSDVLIRVVDDGASIGFCRRFRSRRRRNIGNRRYRREFDYGLRRRMAGRRERCSFTSP